MHNSRRSVATRIRRVCSVCRCAAHRLRVVERHNNHTVEDDRQLRRQSAQRSLAVPTTTVATNVNGIERRRRHLRGRPG